MPFGKHITHSPDETHLLGKALAIALPTNTVVTLLGDLGAGKTTFVRGLAEGVGSIDSREVCSPTFTLLNLYHGKKTIYHFDLYRLPKTEEFYAAGFDEYFTAGGICCIEWAEKIASILPLETIQVSFVYLEEGTRQIEITRNQK